MLKRHFTMIYSQLDDLREKMTRVESNIADLAIRMQELNRKYAQLEGSNSQISEAAKASHDLTQAVDDLKRDINSLRARFESELLSLGDPVNSREKPSIPTQVTPPPIVQPRIETPPPQPEPEPPEPTETPPAPAEQTPIPAPEAEPTKSDVIPEPSSDKKYEPAMKSLEEQLGLVPPSDEANNQSQEKQESKPEEKKKRRFF